MVRVHADAVLGRAHAAPGHAHGLRARVFLPRLGVRTPRLRHGTSGFCVWSVGQRLILFMKILLLARY